MLNDSKFPWGFVGFLGLALALVAIVSGYSPSQNQSEKESPRPSPKFKPVSSQFEGPLGPVRDFFRAQQWQPESKTIATNFNHLNLLSYIKPSFWDFSVSSPNNTDHNFYNWHNFSKDPDIPIEFLIATIPDPVDSGLPFEFDKLVEAIQRALEKKASYVVDRSWLPWTTEKKKKLSRLHERHPGVVLMRQVKNDTQGCEKLLLLLLIGETPAKGIQTEAFLNSLKLVGDYYQGKKKPIVRIIAPYFSGSIPSLILAFKGFCTRYKDPFPFGGFHLISGGANGFYREAFSKTIRHILDNISPKLCWNFKCTLHLDDILRKWAMHFLADPLNPETTNKDPKKVLIIQETGTEFGLQHGKKTDITKITKITIPFPLYISQVRSAYSKIQLAKLEKLGLPRPGLSFPEDDPGTPGDPVPDQDPNMSTTTNDLILRNIVATIRKEKIRYVGIQATDVRDIIFLATYIRSHHADIQIFTTTVDLLLAHPDNVHALRGMVVASTYPLNLSAQALSQDIEDRILFPNDESQGYYNATIFHLKNTDHLLDYGFNKETIPGVWINVIGQNGQLIPIHYVKPDLALDDKGKKYFEPKKESEKEPKMDSIQIPTPLLFLGGFLIGLVCFLIITNPIGNILDDIPKTVFLTAAISILSFIIIIILSLILGDCVGLVSLKISIIILLGVVCLIMVCKFLKIVKKVEKMVKMGLTIFNTGLVLCLSIIVSSILSSCCVCNTNLSDSIFNIDLSNHTDLLVPTSKGRLWLERAIFASNGVSPFLPILLLCVGLGIGSIIVLRKNRHDLSKAGLVQFRKFKEFGTFPLFKIIWDHFILFLFPIR